MLTVLLLALAAPPEVRVLPFDVPEEIHDHIKNEVKRWPKLFSEEKADKVRFVDDYKEKGKEAASTLRGRVSVVDDKKLVIEARVYDGRRILWSDKYELTEFAKKVEFLDETRGKIAAAVKKAVGR